MSKLVGGSVGVCVQGCGAAGQGLRGCHGRYSVGAMLAGRLTCHHLYSGSNTGPVGILSKAVTQQTSEVCGAASGEGQLVRGVIRGHCRGQGGEPAGALARTERCGPCAGEEGRGVSRERP